MLKIALLGVCNSRNCFRELEKEKKAELVYYGFQTCFLDITHKNQGLEIPYKNFYNYPCKNSESAVFTKKVMQADLNKSTFTTIETLNPDYLVVDLSSLTFRCFRLSYRGKSVFSCNAYNPNCYKFLSESLNSELKFELAIVNREQQETAVEELAKYLKENWDLSKIVIFSYQAPRFFVNSDDFTNVQKYPDDYWAFAKEQRIQELTDKLVYLLENKVKVFEDVSPKIAFPAQSEIKDLVEYPSTMHTDQFTQKLQGLKLRNFLLGEKENLETIDSLENEISQSITTRKYSNLITIVVPVYNAMKYLSNLLHCLENQTSKIFKVIFVDDASTDGSADFIEAYHLPNSKVIRKEKNSGPAESRNIGLQNLETDYFVFCDADDAICSNYIESLQKALENLEKGSIVYTNRAITADIAKTLEEENLRNLQYEESVKDFIPLGTNRTVFRKDIVDKFNLRFENISNFEGELFNMRYLYSLTSGKETRVVFLDNTLYYHWKSRNRTGTVTTEKDTQKQLNRFKKSLPILDSYLKEFQGTIFEETISNFREKTLKWIEELKI